MMWRGGGASFGRVSIKAGAALSRPHFSSIFPRVQNTRQCTNTSLGWRRIQLERNAATGLSFILKTSCERKTLIQVLYKNLKKTLKKTTRPSNTTKNNVHFVLNALKK